MLSKRPCNDPIYSAHILHCVELTERLSRVIKQENICQLTAEQSIKDLYVLWLRRTTSTAACRVVTLFAQRAHGRMDAVTADSEVTYAQFKQEERGSMPAKNQGEQIIRRLLSMWLICPLGGGQLTTCLGLGKVKKLKVAVNIHIFFVQKVRSANLRNSSLPLHNFAGDYDTGLASRVYAVP